MSLNGLIVLDSEGNLLYSKIVKKDLKLNIESLKEFFSTLQSFTKELDTYSRSCFEYMKIKDFIIIYRQIEFGTFIGITDEISDLRRTEIILEYLILAFLSKFRSVLLQKDILDHSQFSIFDDFFLNYRSSKEKKLKTLFETDLVYTNILQGILNKLTSYFPLRELVKLNQDKLKIIGNKLIWVKLNIEPDEEQRIFEELRNKTREIYGSKVFESIEKAVKRHLIK